MSRKTRLGALVGAGRTTTSVSAVVWKICRVDQPRHAANFRSSSQLTACQGVAASATAALQRRLHFFVLAPPIDQSFLMITIRWSKPKKPAAS
jgi:hypothetical protein